MFARTIKVLFITSHASCAMLVALQQWPAINKHQNNMARKMLTSILLYN